MSAAATMGGGGGGLRARKVAPPQPPPPTHQQLPSDRNTISSNSEFQATIEADLADMERRFMQLEEGGVVKTPDGTTYDRSILSESRLCLQMCALCIFDSLTGLGR